MRTVVRHVKDDIEKRCTLRYCPIQANSCRTGADTRSSDSDVSDAGIEVVGRLLSVVKTLDDGFGPH